MKIAILNKYQNRVARGAETFVEELSKRLRNKHEVSVISNVNYLDLLRRKYNVIVPTNGRLQVILVRKITWLRGEKMIVSGQSGIGWDDRVNLYSLPDAFVALSDKARNWARKVNPLVKSVYIPNGVDLQKFKPEGPKFKVGLEHPVVLAVGAFTEQKRLDLTIRAVAKLKNVNLLIVGGGGDLKESLEEEGKSLLGDRFKIMSVSFEKMPGIYRSADVFTLPSASSEAFGNVLVEAMASELPVVATNDPIRREIIGDAGLLVDPTNIEEYAMALQKALDTSWGAKPRIQAEKFDWDIIAKEYEELLKNLFQKK